MSLYSLTPESDNATSSPGKGTLQVDVPHWSARIRILDDRQQIITGDAA
jgi:hypothetical protein